jgi:hypothetical protein
MASHSAKSGAHQNFYADYVIQYCYANAGKRDSALSSVGNADEIRSFTVIRGA